MKTPFILGSILALACNAFAESYNFNGSGDWSNLSNWAEAPTSAPWATGGDQASNVIINAGSTAGSVTFAETLTNTLGQGNFFTFKGAGETSINATGESKLVFNVDRTNNQIPHIFYVEAGAGAVSINSNIELTSLGTVSLGSNNSASITNKSGNALTINGAINVTNPKFFVGSDGAVNVRDGKVIFTNTINITNNETGLGNRGYFGVSGANSVAEFQGSATNNIANIKLAGQATLILNRDKNAKVSSSGGIELRGNARTNRLPKQQRHQQGNGRST